MRSPSSHPSPRPWPREEVDSGLWPDVASVPRASPPHRAVAHALVRRAADRTGVCIRMDGQKMGTGPLLEVHDTPAFLSRIGTTGLIGFGESYMAEEWDAPDLVGVLTRMAAHMDGLVPRPLQRLRPLWRPRPPSRHHNNEENSRRNVADHYDTSNDLFELFLDETLSYSSAVFTNIPAHQGHLAQGQHNKIDRILNLAGAGPDTRLLEIGTGWGELALQAARRGAQVVSVTLSDEQRQLATTRVRDAGLQDRVTVLGCDYRQVEGAFDAVVSVEMIEAVGDEHWTEYFAALEARLAPGGTVVLQAITMPHDRLRASRRTYTWMQKYIFPGGLLPSTTAIRHAAASCGLHVTGSASFGPHYAETLRLWRERFTDRQADVDALGFDRTFQRMWALYLAYSEAGFRSGYLDVHQLTLARREGPS